MPRTMAWYGRQALVEAAKAEMRDGGVVMDIGCGIRPQQLVPGQLHILVEPHAEYVQHLRDRLPDGGMPVVILQGTWADVMPLFPDRSVDTVIAGDVIEHLDKAEGWRFLAEAQRVTRAYVVIFTPLGYYPQQYDEPDRLDRWGLHGGRWQTHRSGWVPEEFDDGWEVLACEAYHTTDEFEQPLAKPFGAFYAIWTRP